MELLSPAPSHGPLVGHAGPQTHWTTLDAGGPEGSRIGCGGGGGGGGASES